MMGKGGEIGRMWGGGGRDLMGRGEREGGCGERGGWGGERGRERGKREKEDKRCQLIMFNQIQLYMYCHLYTPTSNHTHSPIRPRPPLPCEELLSIPPLPQQ